MALSPKDIVSGGYLDSPTSIVATGYLVVKKSGGGSADIYYKSPSDKYILQDDEDILTFVVAFMGTMK